MDETPTFYEWMIVEPDPTNDYKHKRERWLARVVLQRWTFLVRKRHCPVNMDFIDFKPVPPQDALTLTDVRSRTVYIFHYRDVQATLLANLCQQEDMVPNPRTPTNPYTNEPLTLTQTIAVCTQLSEHAARRGRCIPVIIAAYWAARFDVKRFSLDNESMLAKMAIVSFFKEINELNIDTICDTITQLLEEMNLAASYPVVLRWLRESPVTAIHRDWLSFVRDYTIYMNLNIQPRESWTSLEAIHSNVRELYDRSWAPPVSLISLMVLALLIQPSSTVHINVYLE